MTTRNTAGPTATTTFSFADYYDPAWMGFRSLQVINDDLMKPGIGFGKQPYHDMEIVTYILIGSLEHKDSMGNGRIIRAGKIQDMVAGKGEHRSEFNTSLDEPIHLPQIWVQLDQKDVTPRYAEKSHQGCRSRHPASDDKKSGARQLDCHPSGYRPMARKAENRTKRLPFARS